jgi:hypothetical protein
MPQKSQVIFVKLNKLEIRYFQTSPQQADWIFARKLVGQSTDYHEFSKNLRPYIATKYSYKGNP